MTPSGLKRFYESPEFAFINAYLEYRTGLILQGFRGIPSDLVKISEQQGRLSECDDLTQNLKDSLNEFLRHNSKET